MGDTSDPQYEPPIDSGDNSSEEDIDDGPQPTGLDDHTSDSDPESTEESETDDTAATPGGAPPSGGGSTGGGGGAPIPTPAPTPEGPSGEEPDEDEDSDPETPDHPENPDSDTRKRKPESEEQPDPDEPDDQDQDDDDEDDDDETDQEARIVLHSDAWDSIAWGLSPVRLHLKEMYGDQIQFDDRLVPVREFDSPDDRAQHWEKWAPRHGMPVTTDVWTDNPPESTALSNRAYAAAREQSIPLAKRFLRRLRMAAIVEERNIEDRDTLLELAGNIGLDTAQLQADWDDVDLRQSSREIQTPKTTIHVDGETITQVGLLTVNDVQTPLKRAGLEADAPQPLPGFVADHGPVALKEIQQVYDYTPDEARTELDAADEVTPVKYGETTFWVTM